MWHEVILKGFNKLDFRVLLLQNQLQWQVLKPKSVQLFFQDWTEE